MVAFVFAKRHRHQPGTPHSVPGYGLTSDHEGVDHYTNPACPLIPQEDHRPVSDQLTGKAGMNLLTHRLIEALEEPALLVRDNDRQLRGHDSLGRTSPSRTVVSTVYDRRIPVPPGISQGFTEVAQGAWFSHHVLGDCGDPRPGSNFVDVNALYPFEKVSDRARHYVAAGLEHLVMWADFAAPFKFHPEQTTTFTMRPTFALARAAMRAQRVTGARWLIGRRRSAEQSVLAGWFRR